MEKTYVCSYSSIANKLSNNINLINSVDVINNANIFDII